MSRYVQDSLGGNSKTLMFANVGPADYNYDETLSTLRYASRAKSIQNHARINEDPKDALMKQYQKEIEQLRRMLEEGGDASSGEEDEEESEEDEDEEGVVTGGAANGEGKRRKSVSQGGAGVKHTQQELDAMRNQVESERKRLREEKDMAEEERNKAEAALKKHEEELRRAQSEYNAMRQKLQALERKIIVGGENLLEKAEEQERLLGESARELEETVRREEKLRAALKEKEAERVDIEEKYSDLREEAQGKARKLKKVWSMYQGAKGELADLQGEQQREMEGLLDSVRQLTRELRLQMLVIDQFVPADHQVRGLEDAFDWWF